MSSRFKGVRGDVGAALGKDERPAPDVLPGMLSEGAVLSIHHEAASGMIFLVVRKSRFDIAPTTVPLPAHLITAVYARILNDQVNRMAGVAPQPGVVPVMEMGIGPAPIPT